METCVDLLGGLFQSRVRLLVSFAVAARPLKVAERGHQSVT